MEGSLLCLIQDQEHIIKNVLLSQELFLGVENP